MKVTRVVERIVGSELEFSLWVYCWDEFNRRDRPYSFKWDDESVIFMFGGQKGQARMVGKAGSREEALRVAEEWLEGWLRLCGVL